MLAADLAQSLQVSSVSRLLSDAKRISLSVLVIHFAQPTKRRKGKERR